MILHSRTRLSLSLSLATGVATCVALWVTPAFAGGKSGGALSNTTRSVRNATNAPSRPAASSSSGSSTSSSTGGYYYNDGFRRGYCATCTYMTSGRPPARGAPGQQSGIPTRLLLDLGIQSVEDSDGAIMGSLRMLKGKLGIGLSGRRYVERAPALDGSDTIHMDIWTLVFMGRGYHTDRTSLWLNGGIGGSKSNEFESLTGATVGVRLEHALLSSVSVHGSARYFILEQDMRARELHAGVSISYIRFGYRLFSFDVGQRLQGPEFGVSLQF